MFVDEVLVISNLRRDFFHHQKEGNIKVELCHLWGDLTINDRCCDEFSW